MTRSNALKADTTSTPSERKPARKINDLDLKRWKDYDEIITDSLWMIPERDRSGAHSGDYHGNFVPQIPKQTMLRYTKAGDCVIDGFAGSGTTLIEGRNLGRHVIGVDLSEKAVNLTKERVLATPNPHGVSTRIMTGDSRSVRSRIKALHYLHHVGKKQAQMVMLHPPYHDIIQFSETQGDLSNAQSTSDFVTMFTDVVANLGELLEPERHLVLVIGDKYTAGEWIPLGFLTMQGVISQGFTLKSIVVKNMTGNRAKRNVENLWRFRALSGGFYIFKHEYVMVFKKNKPARKCKSAS